MWERPRPGAASSCGLLAKGSGRQSAAGSKAQEGLRLLAAQKMDDCKDGRFQQRWTEKAQLLSHQSPHQDFLLPAAIGRFPLW